MATRRNGTQGGEQRLKGHHVYDGALRLTAGNRKCQRGRERNARQQKAGMRDDQRQCRPARQQLAVAGIPKLARGQQRIGRANSRHQAHARLQRYSEALKLKGRDPDRRARRQQRDMDAPAFEASGAAPHHAVGAAQQRVGGADRP